MSISSRFTRPPLLAGLAALLLAVGTAGCGLAGNVLGGNQGGGVLGDDNEQVRATIDELGRDYLVADRVRYDFTRDTSFGRDSDPSELSIGDEVLIEYESGRGRARRVVRIERADDRYGNDDDYR